MKQSVELARVRDLRDRGLTGQYVAAAQDLATRYPDHVDVRMEAAYACESVGEELTAIEHYDAAWALGIPDDEGAAFAASYGATLSALGRLDEAVAILGEAVQRYPDYAPLKAFLAVALYSHGHPTAAMATLLQLLLEVTRDDQLDGFESALAQVQTDLVRTSMERP